MLGDNMSVVLNTEVPPSVLKKKHNAIAYHWVMEAIAANFFIFPFFVGQYKYKDHNDDDEFSTDIKSHCRITLPNKPSISPLIQIPTNPQMKLPTNQSTDETSNQPIYNNSNQPTYKNSYESTYNASSYTTNQLTKLPAT